jgi:hypothetical protein
VEKEGSVKPESCRCHSSLCLWRGADAFQASLLARVSLVRVSRHLRNLPLETLGDTQQSASVPPTAVADATRGFKIARKLTGAKACINGMETLRIALPEPALLWTL